MERYFTTIALLGVDEGNLPVHRYVTLSSEINFTDLLLQRYETKEIRIRREDA